MTDAAHPALIALANASASGSCSPATPVGRRALAMEPRDRPASRRGRGARRPRGAPGAPRRRPRRRAATRRAAQRPRGIRNARRHGSRAHRGIRPARRRRRGPRGPIGAGVRMGRVLEALAGTGLVAMSGSSGVVNATAFTLAGGHSWFARSLGFASSSLRAVELLTADGRHRWLRDADEPELLWAPRRGRRVRRRHRHRGRPASGAGDHRGRLVFARTDAAAVFRAASPPVARSDTLALHAGAVRIPDVPQAPAELRGRLRARGDRRTRRIRRGTRRPRPDPRRRHGRPRHGRPVRLRSSPPSARSPPTPRRFFWSALADLDGEPSTDWSRRGSQPRGSPSWGSRSGCSAERSLRPLHGPPSRARCARGTS